MSSRYPTGAVALNEIACCALPTFEVVEVKNPSALTFHA